MAKQPRRRPPARRRRQDVPSRLMTRDFDTAGARLRYVPELDDFQGDVTLAEAQTALAVRQGFLRALVNDPRVTRWLTDRARAAVEARRIAPNHLDGLLKLVRDELGLNWPWCNERIIEVFAAMMHGAAVHDLEGGRVEVEIPEPHEVQEPQLEAGVHAPPTIACFMTQEGEAVDDALQRAAAFYRDLVHHLLSAAAPAAGGRASHDHERLRLLGRWYYENRVARPRQSINALAKIYRRDRKVIRDGIRKAGVLLSLGAFELAPPGGKVLPSRGDVSPMGE